MVYEVCGCFCYGNHCLSFLDIITTNGDNLAARYERTIYSVEHITRAGYQVKVQWECQFDDAGMETPELLAHPAVCRSPLCTRDAR